MKSETITIRSSVLPDLMRKTLRRGTLLAGIGVLALLFGGVFIPVEKMRIWGPFLFLFSLGMITWGLLPYKRLKRLEDKPSMLVVEGDGWLHYSVGGKPLFSIPIASIDRTVFIDRPSIYGIGVFLKNANLENPGLRSVYSELDADTPILGYLLKYTEWSRKLHGCDLFFPYFSQRSFNTLLECQEFPDASN